MKKKIFLIVGVILALSLSSCLDAIQYITLNQKGDIELSFMITISKALFAMGGEGGSVEDTFTDEILNPDELSAMIPGAKKVGVRLVDSDVDYGYLFNFTIPRNYQPGPETPMVPRIGWDSIEILLGIPGTEDPSAETEQTGKDEDSVAEADPMAGMDEMGEAIFSSAKYKIQISKKLLVHAEKAYVKTESGEIITVDLVDLGDNYLVNLPMLTVMNSEEASYLVFEF